MISKLDVTVAVDMDPGTITVTPTGELTLQNVHGLLPVALRAGSIAPYFSLIIDVGKLVTADNTAVELLVSAAPKGVRFIGQSVQGGPKMGPGRPPRPKGQNASAPRGKAA
jgi:hypothetical protein